MELKDILRLYDKHPQVKALRTHLTGSKRKVARTDGLHGSSAAVVTASLQRRLPETTFLVLLNDEEEAGYFYHDLCALLPHSRVLFFPSAYRRAAKYGQRDAASEVLRAEVITALTSPAGGLIVTYPAALAERVAAPGDMARRSVSLRTGGTYDLPELEHRLLDIGFRRTDYVYEPGEFAVRGSILDVYSYAMDYPVRIDFFGDEVDSIRTFEVQTQLSREKLEDVTVVPEMEQGANNLVPFTDYLPEDTLLVCKDLAFAEEVMTKIYDEGFSRQAASAQAAPEEGVPGSEANDAEQTLNKERLLVSGAAVCERLSALRRIELLPGLHEAGTGFHFSTAPQPIYHKNFDLLRSSFDDLHARGYNIYICADSEKQLERLREIMDSSWEGASPTLHAGFADADIMAAVFTDHQIFDRFHKYNLKSERTRNAKMALTLKELMQFQPGDYIVHIDHGIGRFAGLVRVPSADGSQQEMIKLTYQRDDVVLVSIHALHKLSKYKGKDGEAPRLSRLGTGAWERMKERTKSKLKDIAADLIRLYAARRQQEGFAFSPDTFMQQELEAGFKYEDTPDQLRVTQEVKRDMESRQPMDRLVCGDVGFGKTEIAVRAALKAAVDNKQVAVLVPTTVLALQHYKTFCERLRDFPVKIDYLTRARSPKQVKELLAGLADGTVDIVVGTHKLIGKQVRFKDLGLLIIDEEQKFGVGVKEKLRMMKTGVDTLTMSATPIPRTLQFSMMGARDFSVIETPPPNRRPIQTEIHTFSHEVIAEAVNFEMSRNGQVFIVTNRISALENLRQLLARYVPDARVAVGHGQMPPAQLEEIVTDFINYDYDVLLSTTIVENGIDIPNANTIIIDAAHRFGLSDLHQMRGRVGRSDRKAFCYLLAPPLSLLPDDARRRLQALEQFSDLGSGIHIAMQDLDIRGAGNLLGAEQSGFIADLGYETYLKILKEAMREAPSSPPSVPPSGGKQGILCGEVSNAALNSSPGGGRWEGATDIECDLHAYLPETYVPGASERMMLYRELDKLSEEREAPDTTALNPSPGGGRWEGATAFRRRLEDRFGPLPEEAEELLRIVPLRKLGGRLGCERLVLKGGRMTMYFPADKEHPFYQSPTFDAVIQYAMANFRTCRLFDDGGRRRMTVRPVTSVRQAMEILQGIAQ
ncbi:MAG: transcription-repair coupling factor [Alloprevotella sp.]|nr:transcription-repair coupling factor [Alloprevotella sp.]